MYKKLLGLLIIMLGMCLLTGCAPTTNIEALQKVKTLSIPVKTVNLRVHKANLQSGANYEYNFDPNCGLASKMLPVEKEFLNKELAILEMSLAQLKVKVKDNFKIVDIPVLQDEHLYIPGNSFYFDTANSESLRKACAVNKIDAIGSINLEFFKIFYDEPFVGSFIKIQARAKVKVFTASGEEILFREIIGESTNKLSQNFLLNISVPFMGAAGVVFKKDINFRNNSEYQNYLLKSFNLRNNYGPLYAEALNNLVYKIQQELDTVSKTY